jgi:hypothetical protein
VLVDFTVLPTDERAEIVADQGSSSNFHHQNFAVAECPTSVHDSFSGDGGCHN